MNSAIIMKKGLLMTMAVLTALYAAATDILEHTLLTDPDGQEIELSNESSQVQPVLNDLSGNIIFEEGGNKTSALTGGGEIIDMYEYLYISYSGDEDVEFTILVNDRNLLEDENLSNHVSWDEDNKRYVVSLYGLILPFGDQYCAYLNFDVTVHAMGFNDLSQSHSSFVSWVVDTYGLHIIESGCTDLSYLIEVDYDYSVHYCNLDNIYPVYNNEDWNKALYALPRLDHDYSIAVIAGHRTPMSTVFGYEEKTLLIPARECDISINNSFIKPCLIYIEDLGPIYYTGEQEYGSCFAFITANNIDSNAYTYSQLSISVNNQLQLVKNVYPNAPATAINLLQFGDIYGGKYQINATMTDGYNSLSVDTVLEIHPIATRLTPDSLIIDINPNLNNITLLINGDEIGLSADGHHYALERMYNDYSITVQAGVKITIEYSEGENYTFSQWSDETTIVIPSKPLGDVDEDGLVNINDVTALIDYLLNNDASAINLSNADCDGDGLVNISDITCLIDFLLSGTWP